LARTRPVEGGNIPPPVQTVEGGGDEGPPGVVRDYLPGVTIKKGLRLRPFPQEGEDQFFRRRQLDVGIRAFQGSFKTGDRLFFRCLKAAVIGAESLLLGQTTPGTGTEEET
jgi:hypothetical protein